MGRGRHRWEWACLSVSLMLALRSGTICSILLMSPSAWRRAFRTSSRSISCTFRLRAISYKCHCNVMDVWWRVWGCRKPRGLVTHGASRPMLNFHCQTLPLTLVQGSRNHYPHKAKHNSEGKCQDFPGGLAAKTLHSQSRGGPGSSPSQGTRSCMLQQRPGAAK